MAVNELIALAALIVVALHLIVPVNIAPQRDTRE